MLRILLLILTVLLLMSLFSCQQKRSCFSVELNDSIVSLVSDYVQVNDIDLKRKIISIQATLGEGRSDVYITNINSKVYKESGYAPDFYSLVEDEIVVFVYVGLGKITSNYTRDIVNEIDELLNRHDINLDENSDNFYYAPTWLYSQCSESSKLVKKIDPLEYEFIPCNYSLLQDTTKSDSLFLLKRSINKSGGK